MRKGAWIGGLVAVIGAGYVTGVYLASEQVAVQYQRYVAALSENYRGVATVSSKVDSSFFSSANKLSLEFNDLPEPVLEWAQTNTIDFDIKFSHGFLSSHSVLTIAESELRNKINGYQVKPDKEPLLLSSDYKYDLFEGSVLVTGEFSADAFKHNSADMELLIGSVKGPFSLLDDTFTLDFIARPSSLKVAGMEFQVAQMRLEQSAKSLTGNVLKAGLAIDSEATIKIDGFKVKAQGDGLEVNGLLLEIDQHVAGDRLVIATNYSAEEVRIKRSSVELKFDNSVVKLSLDVDMQASVALLGDIQKLQEQGVVDVNDPAVIFPLLNGLTQKGVNLQAQRLAVSLEGSTLEGKVDLKMDPFSIEEVMLDRQAVLQKLDLEADFLLPKKLLAALPDYDSSQLGFFVGMGFLLDEGDNYRFSISAKQGKVELNGHAMPGM